MANPNPNTSNLKRGGSPGRPKGSRDKVTRTFKASIKHVFEEVATEDPELIRTAVLRGLRGRPREAFPYVQLAAFYLDGKPAETIKLNAPPMQPPYVIIPPPGVVKDR